jgi:membrane protein
VTGDGRAGPAIQPGDLKRAFKRYQGDEMSDRAAGLTYYALMSLFPALLFAVAILGFFGQQGLINDAANYLRDAGAPSSVVDAVTGALKSAQNKRGTAVGALVLGLATSLYGASGAFGAVGRALNVIWRVEEGRGFVRKKATDIIWTLLCLVLLLVTLVLVFLGGSLAADVFGAIGLGDTAATIWGYVRWPLALCSMMVLYALVYYQAPNVEVRRFRLITPGAVFGVVTWIVASVAFFLYVSNFSSYGATYGAFAGAVILLVWLYLSSSVMLLGAELNAVIDLRRTPEFSPAYDGPPLPTKVPADD